MTIDSRYFLSETSDITVKHYVCYSKERKKKQKTNKVIKEEERRE
jgi:hypothetical protein